MPDLHTSLQGRDLGHLRIVAEQWGIELSAPDARVGLQRLVPLLLDAELALEVIAALPGTGGQALDELLAQEGRLPWGLFQRRYGLIREMGSARRDRERPDLDPQNAAEALWYRALVARGFFDTQDGPLEFAYIPDDLLALLPPPAPDEPPALGRPAKPSERAEAIPANDLILDDACTLLAALRSGIDLLSPDAPPFLLHAPAAVLHALLSAAGLVTPQGEPAAEAVRGFLEARREQALLSLVQAWLDSPDFNELRQVPGLACEGAWENDPLRARRLVLEMLTALPPETWWSLNAFVQAVQQHRPDFQRPGGDYDSWYLRDAASGEYLRGYAHWERVEGALLRFLICGPLHWLGLVDLARSAGETAIHAFRFSRWAADLLHGRPPSGLPAESEALQLSSNARIRCPRLAPRSLRYQLARFSQWEDASPQAYRYRLTPAALERARQQGLTVQHLLAVLRRGAAALPPSLLKALERWESRGSEARLEQVLILRLSSPELLQALRASKAARFLGDPLGPTTVIVRPNAAEKVLAALAELGYLADGSIEAA